VNIYDNSVVVKMLLNVESSASSIDNVLRGNTTAQQLGVRDDIYINGCDDDDDDDEW